VHGGEVAGTDVHESASVRTPPAAATDTWSPAVATGGVARTGVAVPTTLKNETVWPAWSAVAASVPPALTATATGELPAATLATSTGVVCVTSRI
jgi:hypothetical protein